VPSDNWPELLPADWKTRDYDGWETWMSGVDPAKATAEAQQNLEAFMREHLAEMTRDGQEFWMSILKEYPGLDISNWPQGQDKNTYPSCYFRKSNDGLALAINLLGNGKNGVWRPSIFILQEEGKGAFPIGTWKESGKSLTFTDTTVTFRIPNNSSVGWTAAYTISDSGDTFVLSNLTRP
jgi:hypothetical protein